MLPAVVDLTASNHRQIRRRRERPESFGIPVPTLRFNCAMWPVKALQPHVPKSLQPPSALNRQALHAHLLLLLVLLSVNVGHSRKLFSLWLREGNDLQLKLGSSLPLYLIRDGVEDSLFDGWGNPWPFSEFAPISHTKSFYEFRWIAKSKSIYYRIRLESFSPRVMPAPQLKGAPAIGIVPITEEPQNFRVYFPCFKNATGTVGRFMVRFEFFRGKRRRKPLLARGPVILALDRQCPPEHQGYHGIYRQETPQKCSVVWGLRRRKGSDLRHLACRSNYIARGRFHRTPDSYNQQFLDVTKQYRRLKLHRTDRKLRGKVAVEILSDLVNCSSWRQIRQDQEYLFFMKMADGRAYFDHSSVVAPFNKKAKRVLKRLRRSDLTCLPDVQLS